MIAVALNGTMTPAMAQAGAAGKGVGGTNQLIVQFEHDVAGRMSTMQQRAALEAAVARAGTPSMHRRDHGGGMHTLRLTERLSTAEVEALAARIAAEPGVAYAEPDRVMRHTAVPNDALYAAQWSLTAPGSGSYGVNLPSAWDVEQGDPGIVVAVIDTGYRPHADLAARILPGYDFVDYDYDTYAGSANDGDGRDSDARDPGDWVTPAEDAAGFFAGCGASPSSWHGTHVAGTIGAASNNGLGVSGVNWNSMILPVRVLGKCGGYLSDIIDGMRWAAGLSVPGVPANPNPAHVLNLSLGGGFACTSASAYQQTIDEIVAAGKVIVVAAGNENKNASLASPAGCKGVITVASTARNGNRARYSNYGSVVNIAAPGGDGSVDTMIVSTLNTGVQAPEADSYKAYQGTSMAAPHVAGIASLLLSANPALTPCQVNEVLRATVTTFPPGSTCTAQTCGAGIVNAGNALAAAQRMRDAAIEAAQSRPAHVQITLTYSLRAPLFFSGFCVSFD